MTSKKTLVIELIDKANKVAGGINSRTPEWLRECSDDYQRAIRSRDSKALALADQRYERAVAAASEEEK